MFNPVLMDYAGAKVVDVSTGGAERRRAMPWHLADDDSKVTCSSHASFEP
jgi:hypothetical protein